jgi:DMSO/TMAO reductase YedYZ molybdopterin-dependent catalytic subunit
MAVTRGFSGRRARDHRLPSGQYNAGDQWPVLHAEPTPSIDATGWTFTLDGLLRRPTTCTWEQVHAPPAREYDGTIHCVTAWSKFGLRFAGVSIDTLLAEAGR